MAANLGEDADTTAAAAGQLAGALYGVSGIPSTWGSRVAWRQQIIVRGLRWGGLDSAILIGCATFFIVSAASVLFLIFIVIVLSGYRIRPTDQDATQK
jgi:hypothetical protein